MKRIIYILLFLLCITTSAFSQSFSPEQKPSLGLQVNWSHSLSHGLVECLLFTGGSGNKVYDLSGKGYHGTCINSPVFAAGRSGTCIDLERSSDQYINTDLWTTGWTAFTIVVLVRLETVSSDVNTILSISTQEDGAGNRPFVFRQRNSVFNFQTNSAGDAFSTTEPSVGIWYHVAVTWDKANNKIYINGVLEDTTAQAAALQTGTNPMRIGEGTTHLGRQFDGLIDHLYFYNRALSASEISLLHQEPYCFIEPRWNWVLYGGLVAPPVGAPQVIFIN